MTPLQHTFPLDAGWYDRDFVRHHRAPSGRYVRLTAGRRKAQCGYYECVRHATAYPRRAFLSPRGPGFSLVIWLRLAYPANSNMICQPPARGFLSSRACYMYVAVTDCFFQLRRLVSCPRGFLSSPTVKIFLYSRTVNILSTQSNGIFDPADTHVCVCVCVVPLATYNAHPNDASLETSCDIHFSPGSHEYGESGRAIGRVEAFSLVAFEVQVYDFFLAGGGQATLTPSSPNRSLGAYLLSRSQHVTKTDTISTAYVPSLHL